jgi:DNA-binding transcriptional MerR regulator
MKDFGVKRLYYKISEVSKLTNLEQHILRYWENEFEQLNPSKNRAGNRIYTNKDIKLILEIKTLLRDKKYTIEGAKKILSEGIPASEIIAPEANSVTSSKSNHKLPQQIKKKDDSDKIVLMEIRNFLLDLKSKL